jgi:1-acyl-sn-glycerol-3-phosphate acyltransferase
LIGLQDWLPYLWYEATYLASFAGMTFGFGLRMEGMHHVPRHGPALLISNHQSYFDPVLVGLCARRHIHYLARKTLFKHKAFTRLILSLNAVPIDQDGIGIDGLRVTVQQLKAGHAVVLFPEGGRTDNGRLQPLKPGVQLLLKRSAAPIVPVGIAGAYEAWSRWRTLPMPAPLFLPPSERSIAVVIGPPLDPRPLAELPRQQALDELAKAIESACARAEQLRRKPT